MFSTLYGDGYSYGFNGMELEDEHSQGKYDFGARIYDSRIGRWLAVDPLARKFPSYSDYLFAIDNPIYCIDEDGRDIVPSNEKSYQVMINHFNSIFEVPNEKDVKSDGNAAMTEVFMMAHHSSKKENGDIYHNFTTKYFRTKKEHKEFRKAFKKARRHLSKEQKELADMYYGIITSNEQTHFLAIDDNSEVKGKVFDDKELESKYGGDIMEAIRAHGGGFQTTETVSSGAGSRNLIVVSPSVMSEIEVQVQDFDDKDGVATTDHPSLDEVIAHEFGHDEAKREGSYGRANAINALRKGNLVREIEGKNTMRTGSDHNNYTNEKIDPKEITP